MSVEIVYEPQPVIIISAGQQGPAGTGGPNTITTSTTTNLTGYFRGNGATVVVSTTIPGSDVTGVALLGSANTFTTGPQTLNTGAAGNNGLIIKGAASQTANLQEWQDSSGTVLGSFDPNGTFTMPFPGTLVVFAGRFSQIDNAAGTSPYATIGASSWLIQNRSAGQVPLILKGAPSQTGNLQEWQNSAGTVQLSVNPAGRLLWGGENTGFYLRSAGGFLTLLNNSVPRFEFSPNELQTDRAIGWTTGTGNVGGIASDTTLSRNSTGTTGGLLATTSVVGADVFAVQGPASHTGNLTTWKNSTGTSILRVQPDYTTGAVLFVSGNSNPVFGAQATNGIESTGSVCTSGTFRVRPGGRNVSFGPGGANTYSVRFREDSVSGSVPIEMDMATGATIVSVSSASAVPLTVKGAASQSANLTEWQNSSGTAVAYVKPNGSLSITVGGPDTGLFDQFGNILLNVDSGGNYLLRNTTSGGSSYLGNSSGVNTGGHLTFQTAGANRVQTNATGTTTFNPDGSNGASVVGVVVKGSTSQTADLFQCQDSSGSALSGISKNGGIKPAHLADTSAVNDTIYFSTDAGKLVYKDSGGSVNNLY